MSRIQSFFRDEDGAVTVDWVILTAGVVLLSLGVGISVLPAVESELTQIALTIDQ